MNAIYVLILLSLLGCSTAPTSYVASKNEKEGYSDKIIDTDLRMTNFQGNASTSKESAELFAKFRAIEICHELGQANTHILLVNDKTYSKEISQTSATGPSYYYGMSPYYGRYDYGMSYGPTTVMTTNETYTYPMYEVYFECVEKPMDARISLKNLSSSQMGPLIKDLQGAVQVAEVLEDSPNLGKLQNADIVFMANGERVTSVLSLYKLSRAAHQQNFKVEFFRNGVKKQTTVGFKDVSELVAHAQAEIIKAACKDENIKAKNKLCKK